MLTSKRTKRLFSTMIMFTGKISYPPNTLNNHLHTYYFADWWQRQNKLQTGESSTHVYTYKNWIKMIKDVYNFNIDYCQPNDGSTQAIDTQGNESFFLFNDWDIYGDSMFLSQFRSVATFDTATGAITVIPQNQRFQITSKLGQHKAVLSDQDVDAQTYSKLFSMSLQVQEDAKIHLNPSSFRHLNVRTPNLNLDNVGSGGSTGFQADWFMLGKSAASYQNQLKKAGVIQNNTIQNIVDKDIFFRMNMCRYNHGTNLSNALGYFQDTETLVNTPNMQGWRGVALGSSPQRYIPPPSRIFVKNIKNGETHRGILIDISNATLDTNTSVSTPVYPLSYTLTVSSSSGEIVNTTVDVQNILENQGGLIFINDASKEIPAGEQLTVAISMTLQDLTETKNYTLNGTESQYTVTMKDAGIKNQLTNTGGSIEDETYQNFIQVDVYCTRYGVPVKSTDPAVTLNISSTFGIDNNGSIQYNTFFQNLSIQGWKSPAAKISDKLLNSTAFRERYQSYDNINQTVFQNQLQNITQVANTIMNADNFNITTSNNSYPSSYAWISKTTKTQFQLNFFENNIKSKSVALNFDEGHKKVKLAMNEDLTYSNNPRYPIFENMAIQGNIHPAGDNNNILDFCCLFYHNKQPSSSKEDWVNTVGPQLRKMGLLYPAMQRIVDLYDFKGVSMPAMKRAFDIEDQNNARYMPSTRQMSMITHRHIRKWLYDPLYNTKIVPVPACRKQRLAKKKQARVWDVSSFNTEKRNLIQTLKNAWSVQFYTIPLYLSALFTSPNQETQRFIRSVSIDEMKHLFIVSNVLNALQDQTLFPGQNAVPFDDHDYIPTFPNKMPVVLQANDPILKAFLNFDIKPCVAEQILKFCCIELPSELGYLNLNYSGDPDNNNAVDPQRQERVERLSQILGLVEHEQNTNPDFLTIGECYAGIIDKFWELSDVEKKLDDPNAKLFTGDSRKQFTYFGLQNMAEIVDLRSALNQFRLIVEEGEGSSLFTLTGDINKESHFIKFIQIYTMCDVSINSENDNSGNAIVTFNFTDGNYGLIDNENFESKWTSTADQQVDSKIAEQFCASRQDDDSAIKYPDTYAKTAFLNAYEKLISECDFIFNTNIQTFKDNYLKEADVSEDEARRRFQVFRRKRMQDAIARMKQMTLHSHHIIQPLDTNPNYDSNFGSRPSYNVQFNQDTSYSCPPPETSSSSKKKK